MNLKIIRIIRQMNGYSLELVFERCHLFLTEIFLFLRGIHVPRA
jgi:hypothetical protein